MLADCAKRTVAPVGAIPPTPLNAGARKTPPSGSDRTTAQEVRRTPATTGSNPAALAKAGPGRNPPVSTFAVGVPVKGREGRSRIDVRAELQKALADLASGALNFEYPAKMQIGAAEQARLKIQPALDDRLKSLLRSRGVPDAEAAALIIFLDAGLSTRAVDSLKIWSEYPVSGPSRRERVWRIQALGTGDHELELRVTLAAWTPSAGDVQGAPVRLSRWVSVSGGETPVTRYWPGIAVPLAALLLVWAAGMLWRKSRSPVCSVY